MEEIGPESNKAKLKITLVLKKKKETSQKKPQKTFRTEMSRTYILERNMFLTLRFFYSIERRLQQKWSNVFMKYVKLTVTLQNSL